MTGGRPEGRNLRSLAVAAPRTAETPERDSRAACAIGLAGAGESAHSAEGVGWKGEARTASAKTEPLAGSNPGPPHVLRDGLRDGPETIFDRVSSRPEVPALPELFELRRAACVIGPSAHRTGHFFAVGWRVELGKSRQLG